MGTILQWLGDLLLDHKQFVKINEDISPSIPVTSSGTALRPTLFFYYINDMLEEVDCIFAFDTKVYTSVELDEKRNLLQKYLDTFVEWTACMLLHFNGSKCKVLHLGKCNPKL